MVVRGYSRGSESNGVPVDAQHGAPEKGSFASVVLGCSYRHRKAIPSFLHDGVPCTSYFGLLRFFPDFKSRIRHFERE